MMKSVIFVLVALLALLPPAFGALNCGSGGAPDRPKASMCNCYSGYAPSTPASLDCNVHALCPPIEQVDESVGEYGATRPVTSFSADKLYIKQSLPIVENRLGATIRLVHPYGIPGIQAGRPGAATCGYPGMLWTKTVNELDCIDEFKGVIPWNSHGMCGFVIDSTQSNNSTLVYKTTIVTQYNETFLSYSGSKQVRMLSNAYSISVSFLRQKTISNMLVQVTMHSPTLKIAIVGNTMFDTFTGSAVLTVRTTASWPYKIESSTLAFANFTSSKVDSPPQGVTGAIASAGKSLSCPSDVNSACQQEWTVTINRGPAENCDIEGEYTFSGAYKCRDGAQCVGAPAAKFNLKLLPVDFCSNEGADASSNSAYTMAAYQDAGHVAAATSFDMGDYIYFVVNVVDPVSTLKGITFSSIDVVTKAGTKDIIYSTTGQTPVSGIDFKMHEVSRVVKAGETAQLTFSFQLVRPSLSQSLGSVTAGGSVSVALEAVINLVYYGDKKREVEVALEVTQGSATQNIVITDRAAKPSAILKNSSPMYTIPILSIIAILSFVLLF